MDDTDRLDNASDAHASSHLQRFRDLRRTMIETRAILLARGPNNATAQNRWPRKQLRSSGIVPAQPSSPSDWP
ncbi:hypothetical protein [Mesorhizobium sp. IMUNJ 23232]|uniref:hypothetical protein n=1 Tax=Mesorhizobium sp. IMUNJ 23232 TaxID=3376064 RepID=UPI003797F69F